jgi:hypothetical protein
MSQDSEQDKVSQDDESRRPYPTSPSLAFVLAPAPTRSPSSLFTPPSLPTHQTSHPGTDHSHLPCPTLPPPSSRLPIHAKRAQTSMSRKTLLHNPQPSLASFNRLLRSQLAYRNTSPANSPGGAAQSSFSPYGQGTRRWRGRGSIC